MGSGRLSRKFNSMPSELKNVLDQVRLKAHR